MFVRFCLCKVFPKSGHMPGGDLSGILQPFLGQDLTSAASPVVGSRFWRIGPWMRHGGA